MRFVDREQRQPGPRQQIEASRRHQPFGRHVEQIERAVADRALGRRRFGQQQPRIQCRGGHTRLAQRVNLVFISAISGETTTPRPGRSDAGIW